MDPATGVPNFVTCASGDTSFLLANYEPDVRRCVWSLPHSCRHVGPDTHTVFVDALPSPSSTRETEPWYVVEEIVACRHYRREHKVVSAHRHDAGLYSTLCTPTSLPIAHDAM